MLSSLNQHIDTGLSFLERETVGWGLQRPWRLYASLLFPIIYDPWKPGHLESAEKGRDQGREGFDMV